MKFLALISVQVHNAAKADSGKEALIYKTETGVAAVFVVIIVLTGLWGLSIFSAA